MVFVEADLELADAKIGVGGSGEVGGRAGRWYNGGLHYGPEHLNVGVGREQLIDRGSQIFHLFALNP